MGLFDTVKKIGKVALAPTTGGASLLPGSESIINKLGVATGLKSPGLSVAGKSPAQIEVEKMLLAKARGEGTSVAELQLKQAQQQSQKKLLEAMAAQRSRNAGLARREALQAGAEQQANIGQQGALLRAEEQADAMSQLLGAGQRQQQMETQAEQANIAGQQQAFSNLLSAGGQVGAAAMSDKNCKKNIQKGDGKIKNFLDSIKGMSYNYKEGVGENPKDKNIGVMAQDLEKTPEGKAMVKEDANGHKNIDFGNGFNAMLASMSYLNDKVETKEKDIEKIVSAILKKHKKGKA